MLEFIILAAIGVAVWRFWPWLEKEVRDRLG